MKKVVVASHNPVKIQAALNAFQKMFPAETFSVEGVSAPSGVSDQPWGDAETYQGALNRARGARELKPQADFWVGIEGGVMDLSLPEAEAPDLAAFAWAVVCSDGSIGKGRTGLFVLPQAVRELVEQGLELGEADDRVFGRSNSKQENGAVGLLTGDVIDRAQLYEPAVIFALIPVRNPGLYKERE